MTVLLRWKSSTLYWSKMGCVNTRKSLGLIFSQDYAPGSLRPPPTEEVLSTSVLFPDAGIAGCKAVFSSDVNWKKFKDVQRHAIVFTQGSTKLVKTSQFGRKLTEVRT